MEKTNPEANDEKYRSQFFINFLVNCFCFVSFFFIKSSSFSSVTLVVYVVIIIRSNNNAEFFHHFERLPEYITSRVQSNCDEYLGWRLHVLHLCIASWICLCQLCGKETSIAQCCLSTRRKSRNSGKWISPSIMLILCWQILTFITHEICQRMKEQMTRENKTNGTKERKLISFDISKKLNVLCLSTYSIDNNILPLFCFVIHSLIYIQYSRNLSCLILSYLHFIGEIFDNAQGLRVRCLILFVLQPRFYFLVFFANLKGN